MKNFLANFLLLFTISNCYSVTDAFDMNMWKSCRVDIPHFVVEFSFPPELKQGYGKFRKEVLFENPPDPQFTSLFFERGAYSKDIGTLFLGVKGDFSEWDIAINIFVVKYDITQRPPIRSLSELAKFVQEMLSKKYELANGRQVDDLGGLTIEKIGLFGVVVATRSDPDQVRMIRVQNAQGERTDVNFPQNPYRVYYIRLDDEVVVGIRVSYDNPKKIDSEWYAENHAKIIRIIENMKVKPKK